MVLASPSPRRTRLEADDRRDQIVEAAKRLFADRPYDSVSTGDIATASGTTRTNIHYHFVTKRELYLEIVRRYATVPNDLVPPAFDSIKSELVEGVLSRWLDATEKDPDTFLALVHGSSSTDPIVNRVLADSTHAWETRLSYAAGLDRDNAAHSAMVRSYQAMALLAATELVRGNLTKSAVLEMLTNSLITIATTVHARDLREQTRLDAD